MSSDERKKVEAILVLEVLGRPPEYLKEALNNFIKTMGEEKGVKIKNSKINEPVEMKSQKDFYTSFAEIEVEVEEIVYLEILIFKYMPAHVEIVSPQNLTLSNSGFNDLFNELTRRLHGYEEITRMLQTEKKILENQLKTIVGDENKEAKEDKKEEKAIVKEKKKRETKKKIKKEAKE